MSDLAQELLELKRIVRKAEDELTENKGALKQLKSQLKSRFKVKTTKEAKALMNKLQKEYDELDSKGKKLEKQIRNILEEEE